MSVAGSIRGEIVTDSLDAAATAEIHGNIHCNVSQPVGADKATYIAQWGEMNRVIHDLVVSMNGSISAEHGVGRLKVEELEHYKDPIELDLLRRLKEAFDPAYLLNPGKVVSVPDNLR